MKMRESTLRSLIKNVIQEDLGMSPPMHRKGDPEYHLKRALKKWHLEDKFDGVMEIWNYMSPTGARSFHNMYLETFEGEEDPGQEAILDIFRALVRDQKAADRRGSYSF